ncbi:hypothetical protein [Halotia branconii]|uniref:Uncharacterized protein n=1 Tax=Halotia branconii CENA392 TaxID=1539056 RepID=A0AAJ6PA63_9CYAN|nr:hypothetical protein [Halotia branconii]WGV26386.1 hypothetical protein QI031_02410 [Halotia branconii CENA392]
MKSKIVAIIAASAAALGSTIFAAPAHAQISGSSDVNVQVTVPEVLYLRTVDTIDVSILPTDLTAATLNTSGTGFFGTDKSGIADGTTSGLDQTSPFYLTGGNLQVNKDIPEVFAIWSNSPRGNGVTVATTVKTPTLTATNGATIQIAGVTPMMNFANVPGLINPFVSGVTLSLNLNGSGGISDAGAYTGGEITVTATAE